MDVYTLHANISFNEPKGLGLANLRRKALTRP